VISGKIGQLKKKQQQYGTSEVVAFVVLVISILIDIA